MASSLHYESVYEYMIWSGDLKSAETVRDKCTADFLNQKRIVARECVAKLQHLPQLLQEGQATFAEAAQWAEVLRATLGIAKDDQGYAPISLALRSQAVLCHLRATPPDWKAGKKALGDTFAAKGKREEERQSLLLSALETAQRKDTKRLAQTLGKHPAEAVHKHVSGWVTNVASEHLKEAPLLDRLCEEMVEREDAASAGKRAQRKRARERAAAAAAGSGRRGGGGGGARQVGQDG